MYTNYVSKYHQNREISNFLEARGTTNPPLFTYKLLINATLVRVILIFST